MPTAQEHDHYWSEYLKKDPCFLSTTEGVSKDEQFTEYQRQFCQGLKGAHVLEVGCGDGRDAIAMVREYDVASLVAIDVSEKRVGLAKENIEQAGLGDRIQVRKMDAHRVDFPDDQFDAIVGNSVCLFLDRERFFPEAVRVLKKGGRLVLFLESLAENPILSITRRLDPRQQKRDVERLANRLTLREIEDAGQRFFAAVEHKEFYPLFVVLRRVIIMIARRYIRLPVGERTTSGTWSRALDRMLLRIFPSLRRYAWISVIRFTTTATLR